MDGFIRDANGKTEIKVELAFGGCVEDFLMILLSNGYAVKCNKNSTNGTIIVAISDQIEGFRNNFI
jgi:hypothetical protein